MKRLQEKKKKSDIAANIGNAASLRIRTSFMYKHVDLRSFGFARLYAVISRNKCRTSARVPIATNSKDFQSELNKSTFLLRPNILSWAVGTAHDLYFVI